VPATVFVRHLSQAGIGAIVAMIFRAAVDQPDRFRSSKKVGAFFGLTPRKYQSGEQIGTVLSVEPAMPRSGWLCSRRRT
jgi:transposase